MTKLTDDLMALQSLLRLGDEPTPEQKTQIEALRAGIPTPVLAHFLRQLAVGRRGVALVRNGVCGECHLRLAQAVAHTLGHSEDLHLCENCGAFVVLAPDQSPIAGAVAAPARSRRVARKARPLAA